VLENLISKKMHMMVKYMDVKSFMCFNVLFQVYLISWKFLQEGISIYKSNDSEILSLSVWRRKVAVKENNKVTVLDLEVPSLCTTIQTNSVRGIYILNICILAK